MPTLPNLVSIVATLRLSCMLPCLLLFTLCAAAGHAGESKKAALSAETCEYVVSKANQGQLQRILIATEPPGTAEPAGLEGVVFRKRLDINNDGVPERVFITMMLQVKGKEFFEVYDLQQDRKLRIGLSEDDSRLQILFLKAMNLALLEFGGKVYLLGYTGESLHYLALIETSNEMRLVCEFGQREGAARLRMSRNDAVCKAALQDRVRFVDFTLPHAVTEKSLREGEYWRAEPGKKAAKIDINNDGKQELVFPLFPKTGLVRGADAAYLAVLDESGTRIDGEATWRIPHGTVSRVLPFVMGGVTYLDDRQIGPQGEHWKIYMLEKDVPKIICDFELRPVNYTLNEFQLIERYARPGHYWGYAIYSDGTGNVEALIKAGRDVNELEATHERPLHMALRQKRYDIVKLLLHAGADPFLRGERMFSPLWGAVHSDKMEDVSVLLDGIELKKGQGCDELNAALYSSSPAMLELLLRRGIAICDEAAVNAVIARNKDKYEKLRILLAYGLEPNRLYAKSVLVSGVRRESSGAVKVGPDFQFKKVNKTLMQWAREAGDPEVLRILSGE